MFNLIRRISNGVILRPDRPWADDATSNAPTKGKKRRLERNSDADAAEEIRTKKIRGESDAPETETPTPHPESQPESEPEPEPESAHHKQEEKAVKEVTKGVEEVELNETLSKSKEVKPETVPLPEEDDAEELQEDADTTSDDVSSSVAGEEEVVAPLETEPKGREVKANKEEGIEEKRPEEAEKETKQTPPAELAR
ncbi:hypothetical protein C0992_001628 [Termitomyces sp. T32_za158]|nr:hypothetical protein C0992_001628 [Termitomyces sp. T32_za158]